MRPHPLHGARSCGSGEGSERKDADGYMVAYNCQPKRPREDRLSDAEAAGHSGPDRQGSLQPGDLLLDFFAGSGSFGEAAVELGRKCILVDNNEEALRVMEKRFAEINVEWVNWTPGAQHDAPVQRKLFA